MSKHSQQQRSNNDLHALVAKAAAAPRNVDVVTGLTLGVNLFDSAKRCENISRVGWTDEQIIVAIERYGKFLNLVRHLRSEHADRSAGTPISPTWEIDEIWHLHMLSPVAYWKDCRKFFGFLLDHDGGFGKQDSEVPALKVAYFNTERFWRSLYSEDYAAPEFSQLRAKALGKAPEAHNCWHDCQDRCWHACSDGVVLDGLFAVEALSA